MKANIKKALTAAAACALAVSAVSLSAFAAEDTAAGDTSKYPDSAEITAALGVGWNLGNQLEASSNGMPNETIWAKHTITQDTLHMVKEAGFDSVRIPVSYLKKIGSADTGYKIDEAWLNRVQEVVDYAIAEDLYVVINMHGDGYTTVTGGWLLCAEEDQTEIKAKYESCWSQIAEKFKDYDSHLIFESMNEEFDGTYGNPKREAYQNINDYNQIFVDTVRSTGSNNGDRWLLVPGWNTNIDQTVNKYGYVDPFGFELPDDSNCTADSNRLMVSVHYYDPWGFCGDDGSDTATQWGADADSDKKDNYGQEDALDTQFKKLYDNFTSQGIPVIIGELGAIDKSSRDSENLSFREKWYSSVISKAVEYGCVPMIWDNNWNGDNGFGLFDRNSYSVTQPTIIQAVMEAKDNSVFIGYPGGDDSSSEADTSSESAVDSSSAASTSSVATSSESTTSASSTDSAVSSAASSTAATSSAKANSTASASTNKDSSPDTGVQNGVLATIAIVCAGAALTVVKKKR